MTNLACQRSNMACLSSGATGAMFSNMQDSFLYSNLNSTHITKVDFQSSLFSGIVLCYWDNIIGPRLSHLWLESEEKCKEDTVKYVVFHCLNGELTREAPKNAVDTKLFIINERNLVFSSFIFTGLSKGAGETLYSLSLLLPFSAIEQYLPFQELVDVRVKLLVAKLRVLQEKDCFTAISHFSKHLPSFINTMSSLQVYGLPSNLSIWNSAFSPDNSSCFTSEFLEKSITSHLATFGSSVIVGKAVKLVNLMVSTLAMFLSPEERRQSRYVSDEKILEYEPDLYVQGILMQEDGSFPLPSKSILISRFPTTVIDLEKMDVERSCLYGDHCNIRHQFLNLDLECLWNDDEDAPLYPFLGLFHQVKHDSKIINEMLHDIQILPPDESIRLAYIQNFMRLLKRKAVALIKYIEDLTKFGNDRLDNKGFLEARQQLRLTKDGDLLIVLAVAEKIRPNMYTCALGECSENSPATIFRNVLGCL